MVIYQKCGNLVVINYLEEEKNHYVKMYLWAKNYQNFLKYQYMLMNHFCPINFNVKANDFQTHTLPPE